MLLIAHLFAQPVMRYSDLRRAIPEVSPKMLTQQLRDLEHDGIVQRTVYAEVPPKVEYSLTPSGLALHPTLKALYFDAEHVDDTAPRAKLRHLLLEGGITPPVAR